MPNMLNLLLNDWFTITNYKKENNTVHFVMGNHLSSYDIKKRNDFIVKVLEEYKSEELASCLLKDIFERYISETSITIKDYLENDNSFFLSFYEKYKSYNVDSKIKKLSDLLAKFYKDKNLLGEISASDISKCVSEVIEDFDKLNVDVLKKSDCPVGAIKGYSSKIYMYDTLMDCTLEMCDFEDGIYIAYIQNKEFSGDGFFTYILKSNGNIISVNDQLKEVYLGQHSVRRQRNANYLQDKNWMIFPYSIFDLSHNDCKGNPQEYLLNLSESDMDVNKLTLDDSLRIYLCMFLFAYKMQNKQFNTDEIKYSSKLVTDSKLAEIESKYPVKSNTMELLTKDYNQVIDCLKVDEKEVSEFTYGKFENSMFADEDWYKRETNLSKQSCEILFKEWYKPTMFEQKDIPSLPSVYNEFVGTKEELREQIVFNTKTDVVKKIRKEMLHYLKQNNFGNDIVLEYRNMLLKNKDKIFKKMIECFNNNDFRYFSTHKEHGIRFYRGFFKIDDPDFILNDCDDINVKEMKLYDDKGKCNIQITFNPKSWLDINEVIGTETKDLPKGIRGWTKDSNRTTNNSILDMYNPYEIIQNPFEYMNRNDENDERYGEFLCPTVFENWQREEGAIVFYRRHNPFQFTIICSKRKLNDWLKNGKID